MAHREGQTTITRIGYAAILLVCLLALLLSAGCASSQGEPISTPAPSPDPGTDENATITIAVTIPPMRQFVEAVGGERVSVMAMVPPGASPHTHEPTPGQLRFLAEADAYVMVGSGIEFETIWMARMASLNLEMEVIDASAGIELLSTAHDGDAGTDPHIWTSPANARTMVRTIERELIRLYPAYSDEFSEGADDYVARLTALDSGIHAFSDHREMHPVMVYHPAWAYFAREYNIPLIIIEEDGKEPSPAHLREMIDRAKEEGVTTIIVSPEQTTQSAEIIARETGGKMVSISSLEEDYLSTMQRMAETVSPPG